MARPKKDEQGLLTDMELQLMNIIWEFESATVNEVIERLSQESEKEYAYTTISTMLRILEKKEIVEAVKEGRGHRYLPKIKKETYQEKTLDHMVSNVFDGTPKSLVSRLLGNDKMSQSDLDEIRQLLDEKSEV